MSKALNVAVCQINPTLGNFQKNIDIISKNYKSAVEKGADLVVFPEMSLTGYPPQDLLNNKEFITETLLTHKSADIKKKIITKIKIS